MITLYSGTPGSGKSLHVADVIYRKLRRKQPIICNFDINPDVVNTKFNYYDNYYYYVSNSKLNPQFLLDFSSGYWGDKPIKEGHILLIIDEAQLLFNAREWDKEGRKFWTAFFTQHRKYGYDVILIAQFDRMLDRQIRSLVEYEIVHRKVVNYGWRGVFLSFLLLSPHLFVAVKFWYPLKERIGSEFFKYKSKFNKLYDTYFSFDDV